MNTTTDEKQQELEMDSEAPETAAENEEQEDIITDSDFTRDDKTQEVSDGESEAEESKEETDPDLPEGFTEEPQDKEHMDLGKVGEYEKWVKTYLQVSDDEGHLLGDQELEKEARDLCDELESMDLIMEESPEVWIEKIKDVRIRYSAKLNVAENTSFGILTKYRIREGKLLNFQKTLVKDRLKQKWMVWFAENYGKRLHRSASDYMRIAEVPNSINYAVFGKERLIQIIRQIDKQDLEEKEDPIGDFLEGNGIEFDPEQETDDQELRIETDIAINQQKLQKAGITEIDREKVDALVRNGQDLTAGQIAQFKLAKEAGKDLVEEMDKIISGGKLEPIVTPTVKAEGFKKTTDKFLKAVEDALEDRDYLGGIDPELFKRLKEKIEQLEQHMLPN